MAPRRPVGYRPLLLGRRFRCSRARKSSLRRDTGYHGRLPPLHPVSPALTPRTRLPRWPRPPHPPPSPVPRRPRSPRRCPARPPRPSLPRPPENAGDRRPKRHKHAFVISRRSYLLRFRSAFSFGAPTFGRPPRHPVRSPSLCSPAKEPRGIVGPPAADPQLPAARAGSRPHPPKTQEIVVPRATRRTGDATAHVSPAFSFSGDECIGAGDGGARGTHTGVGRGARARARGTAVAARAVSRG